MLRWSIRHGQDFDEAIYVLDGQLRVVGDQDLEADPGSMLMAPRAHRHGFQPGQGVFHDSTGDSLRTAMINS